MLTRTALDCIAVFSNKLELSTIVFMERGAEPTLAVDTAMLRGKGYTCISDSDDAGKKWQYAIGTATLERVSSLRFPRTTAGFVYLRLAGAWTNQAELSSYGIGSWRYG